jgi:hypothetical protein
MNPLAIIGLGSTHDDAPWQDETWERWGMPKGGNVPRCHFLFEMHSRKVIKDIHGPTYWPRLGELDAPVYMQEAFGDIPTSIEYPLDEVIEYLGRDYFGSTIAYMIGLAIRQHRKRVGFWGIDLNEGYNHQRENLAWLVGQAEARGTEFENTPSLHSILPYTAEGPFDGARYPVRYGYVGAD